MNNEINKNYGNLDKKTINEFNTNKYKCIFHCPILYNDIACSIDLDKNYLVYGTLMGEVALCLIEDFSSYKKNDINDSNITIITGNEKKEKNNENINLKIEDDKKNKNKMNKKNGKDIKIFLNKEPDFEDFQKTKDINSNNLNDKQKLSKKYQNKIVNNYYNKNRIKKLYRNKIENISCISLSNDILNFSVGDFQLFHCEKLSSFIGKDITKAYNFKKVDNYSCNKAHDSFCETAQCFIVNNHYLILYLYYYDFNWPLKFSQVKYRNIDLSNFEEIKGSIYMSNFNVPFDFDGDKFLYLEYYNKNTRCINIFSTLREQKLFQYFIKNDFDHISFMKILPDDSIFLCRKIYLCEIYIIKYNNNNITNKFNENESYNEINNDNKNFILLKSWIHHPNNEIISCNVYIIKNKIQKKKENKIEKDESNLIQTKIKREKEKKIKNRNVIKSLKLIESNNSYDSYSESKNKIFNYKSNNYSSRFNNIDDFENNEKEKTDILNVNLKDNKINDIIEEKISYFILTLDIEGNFNIYRNNSEKNGGIKITLFNLYEIQNIEKKYKDLKFFSLGFPYYITMNDNYYVISTDNGIFVITSEKE